MALKTGECEKRLQEISELNGRFRLSEDQVRELRKAAEAKSSEYASRLLVLEGQLKEGQRVKDSAAM
mgnify:FL=1